MSYSQVGSLVNLFDPDLAREATHGMADDGGDWLLDRTRENTPVSYTGIAMILWGEPTDRVPGTLFDKRLVSLDLSRLVAAGTPEELQARLQKIVSEIVVAAPTAALIL